MTPAKKSLFYLLMVVLTLGVLEVTSLVFYFQYNAAEPFALFHYVRSLSLGEKKHPGLKAVGIWQQDDRFGYSHIAQTTGTHETEEYTVTYSIGPNQERVTPDKKDAKGTVLFLGGSYTFGQGVEDNEAFPAILGHSYWDQWAIENRAVLAWGTGHA